MRTATLFSELVGIAYGYGVYTQPQKEIVERILNDFKDPLSDNIVKFRNLINLSINMPVPLAKQVAAAEQIATLAIKYPELRESALASLALVKELVPQAGAAYDRLLENSPSWWRQAIGKI
jgi:hypothetical protein